MLVGAGLGTSKLMLTDSKDVETSEVACVKLEYTHTHASIHFDTHHVHSHIHTAIHKKLMVE